MSENNINTYKNVFNDLILSDSDRGVFFKRAYEYISQAENISIQDKSNKGALAFIGTVQNRDTQNYDYVFKIGDYLKQITSNNTSSETLPVSELKEYDEKTQNEIEFLLKVQGKDFEDVEYRKIFDIDKQNRPEGAENIIEIKGYGKIQREELVRQSTDAGKTVITDGFDIPFRFFEMPYLDAIDNEFYCLIEALSLGADISNALCCVHDKELFNVGCHRDIKIENILYDHTGDKYDPYRYILTDFNIANHDMERTRNTTGIGTPSTMPPEMFRGKNNEKPFYSYEVDHYSLAATMYCMLNNGIYPKPNGEIRLAEGDKKPYSYPGFDTDYKSKYPQIYVDPREDSSPNRVIEMLIRHGFGENEAVEAAEIYLFIVKQLEYDKDRRAIHKEGKEEPAECTRRVKHAYLCFLKKLGEACFKDKNYDRALKYYGRYISRQERELQYCEADNKRMGEIEKISCDLNLAKYNMGLALIRSDAKEDYDKVTEFVEELGDSLYERGLENAFEYGACLASPENEDFRVLMECMDREKDKSGNYRIFYDKEKWDILTLAFQALQEVDEDNKERDHEILKTLLRDLPANVELPNSIKTSINGLAEKVSYTVKYEVENHPELAPDEKKYTAYYLKNEKYVENLELVSKVVGYKVDEEHSSYPKQGDLLQSGVKYVIKYVKDPEQTKKIKFTVRYQCDGTVFFSEEKECDLWIKDEMHYDESLDKIPEQFADAYSFKSVNKERGAVISDGEKIFVDCEIKYVDTEYIVKHICDGQEVSEDTTSFKSRCWAGKNTKTVTLTKEALQPRTYNGYEYFKILPENAAAGNTLEDHAEIQLWYRKDSDAEKTVFYAVTYYKDGEEYDSVIQRKQVWSGAADRLEIQSGVLGAERYDGYMLDHVEPDIKEGDEISSGSLINVYYVKNPEVQDGFEIEDNTLIRYTGKAKQIVIPNGIEVIGPGAFSAYKELKGVEFPESLKTIGNSAFINCSSLAEVKFSEGLRTIGLGAFYGCNSLNSIEFPESLQYIGSRAFGNCTALKGTICLPETMVQVYKDAFEGCPSINVIREKQSVEIEKQTSNSASTRSTVDTYYIVEHVTEDGNGKRRKYAGKRYMDKDWGDKARPEIMIRPDSLNAKNISGYTYSRIVSSNGEPKEGSFVPSGTVIKLYYVKNQAKETSGSPRETNNAQQSKEKCVGDFIIKGRTLVAYKGEDTHVKIPDGISVIGEKAFSKCNFIETITFPESLQKIESYAFARCTSLKGTVKLPDAISEIEDYAFLYCTSVDWIDMPRQTKLGKNVFYGCKFAEPFRDSGYITSLKSIVLTLLAIAPGYVVLNQYESWICFVTSIISMGMLTILTNVFLKDSDQTRFEAPIVSGVSLIARSISAIFIGINGNYFTAMCINYFASEKHWVNSTTFAIGTYIFWVLIGAIWFYISMQKYGNNQYSNLHVINKIKEIFVAFLVGFVGATWGGSLVSIIPPIINFVFNWMAVFIGVGIGIVISILLLWAYGIDDKDIAANMYLRKQDAIFAIRKFIIDMLAIAACGGCMVLMNWNVCGLIIGIVIYLALCIWNLCAFDDHISDERKPRIFWCTVVGVLTLYIGTLYAMKLTNTIMMPLMKSVNFIGQHSEIFMCIFASILGFVIGFIPLLCLFLTQEAHYMSSEFWGGVITILFMVVIPMVLINVVFHVSADSLQGGIIVIGSIICGVYLLQTMSWIKYKLDLRKARSSN